MSDEILSQEEIQALIQQAGMEDDTASAGENTVQEEAKAPEAQQPAAQPIEQPAVPKVEVKKQPANDTVVRPAEFSPLGLSNDAGIRNGVDLILDVQLQVSVELGRATKQVKDVLALGPGSVVELDKHAGEPVEVVVNNKTIARGEVVVIDENFGVRITEIVNSNERDSRAKAAA